MACVGQTGSWFCDNREDVSGGRASAGLGGLPGTVVAYAETLLRVGLGELSRGTDVALQPLADGGITRGQHEAAVCTWAISHVQRWPWVTGQPGLQSHQTLVVTGVGWGGGMGVGDLSPHAEH